MSKLKIFGIVIGVLITLIVVGIIGFYLFIKYRVSKFDTKQTVTQFIDKAAKKHINGKGAGIAICVIKNDEILIKTYGYADIEAKKRIDSLSIFEIGSISKVFTTEITEILHQRNEINWNENILKYYPFKYDAAINDETKLIHLASHTAGFPRVPKKFFPKIELDTCNPYSKLNMQDLEAYLKAPSEKKKPSTKSFDYSNLGNGLLGHILEWHTKKTYEQLLQQEICIKLDMKSTSIYSTDSTNYTTGYDERKTKTCHWDFPILHSAGAIKSNISDMSQFLYAHLNDPYFSNILKICTEKISSDLQGFVGKGWMTETVSSELMEINPIVWHNGGTGGYSSFIGMLPKDKIGVVILSNSDDNSTIDQLGFTTLMATSKCKIK